MSDNAGVSGRTYSSIVKVMLVVGMQMDTGMDKIVIYTKIHKKIESN